MVTPGAKREVSYLLVVQSTARGQHSRRRSLTRREGKIPANCPARRVLDVERLASPRQTGVE